MQCAYSSLHDTIDKEYVSIPQAVSTVAIDEKLLNDLKIFVSIPQAVSTVAIFFTRLQCIIWEVVSIPQAVSTVAMRGSSLIVIYFYKVSIPQAVSTVAIFTTVKITLASGVSIPQAVSTVAIPEGFDLTRTGLTAGFNTASGKHCCNIYIWPIDQSSPPRFNTASGKHCCNSGV